MIESLINECMGMELSTKTVTMKEYTDLPTTPKTENNTKTAPTAKVRKKSSLKAPREPKITQKYKQSINPSKRHRDRLNGELDNLAKLLPFSEDVIARLDKLSILRLSVSFLRNKNFFKAAFKEPQEKTVSLKSIESRFSSFLSKALDGFILVLTLEGEIFFVSESVKDYLGYSQSSVLHQLLETFVHDDDKEELPGFLRGTSNEKIVELEENTQISEDMVGSQREFIIRLKSVLNNGTSDMYKPFKLSGRMQRLNLQPETEKLKYALFAFCTPARTSISVLEIRMKTTLFCSKNRIDLSFLDLDARGKEYFGYSKKDIFGRSSYVLVHRQDLQHVRCKHTELMTCGKTSIGTFRLMNKNNEWTWISGYGRVMYKNGKPDFLITTNRILTDTEGQAMFKIRDQADYKALETIGLIEPDDPAKALELGFPSRSAIKAYGFMAENEPVPMPLGDFVKMTDNVINETDMLCKAPMFANGDDVIVSSKLDTFTAISEETKQKSPQQQQPMEQQTTPMQQDAYSPASMTSNHSNHSNNSNNNNNSNRSNVPTNKTSPDNTEFANLQVEPDHEKFRKMTCQELSASPQHSIDLGSVSSSNSSIPLTNVQIKHQTKLEYNRALSQPRAPPNTPGVPSMTQRFPTNIFDDLPIDFDPNSTNIMQQQTPPSQPRFSFLPPSFSEDHNKSLRYPSVVSLENTSGQSRTLMPVSSQVSSYNSSISPHEQIGPNVTLCGPEYDIGSLYNGHLNSYLQQQPPSHNDRSSFLPYLLETYLPSNHQNNSNWAKQSEYMPSNQTPMYNMTSNESNPNSMYSMLNNNSSTTETNPSNTQNPSSLYYF